MIKYVTSYLLFAFLFVLSIKAQNKNSQYEDLEVFPVSINPKYTTVINPQGLKANFITNSYDNDSLYITYNKDRDSENYGVIDAFGELFDEEIWMKESSYKFELDTGTIWLFKASTITGKSLDIILDNFELPAGSQLSYFIYDINGDVINKIHGNNGVDLISGQEIMPGIFKDLYIEYYEPKEFVNEKFDFKIKAWGYSFVKLKKSSSNTEFASESTLKSGSHKDNSITYENCNNDINCNNQQALRWKELAKSVFYIQNIYKDFVGNSFTQYTLHGSGVFINKAGNYSESDKPKMLTVRHIYYLKKNDGTFLDLTTLNKSAYSTNIYINYINDVCNSTRILGGNPISGSVDIISLGDSYSVEDQANYNPSEDYLLLEHEYDMKKFARYGVLFAGWQGAMVVNSPSGIASFGHPHGDVMKINIELDPVSIPPDYSYLPLYFDLGKSEEGISGGPVFNYQKHLIGINATKLPGGTCSNPTRASAGIFENMYPDIRPYIDPNGAFTAQSKMYEEHLPFHCQNCLVDHELGETGVDCGGECLPCYLPDNVFISSKSDFHQKSTIDAKYSLNIDPSESVTASSTTKEFHAGEQISLGKNMTFEKGATLVADIDPNLINNNQPRICDIPCLSIGNVITPNGDGINDALLILQKSVSKYRVIITNRYSNKIYDSGTKYVSADGIVSIFDGRNTSRGAQYFVYLQAWNCKDQKVTKNTMLYVF